MHALTFNSRTGLYEVMTRGAAWHHLGQVVEDAQTWEQTVHLAGLDWDVIKQPLEFRGVELPNAYGLFRSDLFAEPEKAFLVTTSETYEVIQNRFMFHFLDALVEKDGGAHYEAAGSLNGGKQVWALINLHYAFEVGASGDRYEVYLAFVEDRTGKKAAKVFITVVRIVCMNTLESAYGSIDDKQAVRFRHTGSVAEKMEQAVGLFTGGRMDVDILRAKLERLSERVLTKNTLIDIIEAMYANKETNEISAKASTQAKEIVELYGDNDNNMFPEIKGTAYNFYNAVTEYYDHFAPAKMSKTREGMTPEQIRAQNAMFGDQAVRKSELLDLILEKTQYEPLRPHKSYSLPSGQGVVVLEKEQTKAVNSTANNGIDISPTLAAILDNAQR